MHTFQGQSEDRERPWNPSDPSMQPDQHATETLRGSLSCHDDLHTLMFLVYLVCASCMIHNGLLQLPVLLTITIPQE